MNYLERFWEGSGASRWNGRRSDPGKSLYLTETPAGRAETEHPSDAKAIDVFERELNRAREMRQPGRYRLWRLGRYKGGRLVCDTSLLRDETVEGGSASPTRRGQ